MDLSPVVAAISDEGIESAGKAIALGVGAGPRLDRRRHRHRLHLRQGDRVGRPPARDERRASEHPLARLRADRGRRLLHLHLRPDRLLPLGRSRGVSSAHIVGSASPSPRRRADEEEGGSFLVSPGLGLMIWTLVLFLFTMWVLSKVAFPKIQEALDKRAKTIAESIEAAERQRKESDELLEEYRQRLAEAREQADDIMARARKAAETAEAEATAGGQGETRGAGRRGQARHRGRDAALAGADPQGGRRPDRAGDREGDPQVAHRRRPAPPGRGGAQRGRLHQPLGDGEQQARCPRSPAYMPRRSSTSPRRRASSTRSASSSASSPTPSRATATCRSSSSAPTSPRRRRSRG